MAYDSEQLDIDLKHLMQLPGWQDPAKRDDFIRDVAVKTRAATDPQTHAKLIDALWQRKDDRGLLSKTGDFVKRGTEEVLKSIPASGMAMVQGVSDATGLTDTGSQTRITGGVKGLVDATGQRLKQLGSGEVFGMNLVPGESRQKQRDDSLQALKKDLDEGVHPAGLEDWLAGKFDAGNEKPDAETQTWIDALTRGLAQKAVAADHMGSVKPERVDDWLRTDRNPARVQSDITGKALAYGQTPEPGPREYLADYLVTRDPKSWDAFVNRVTETDAQYRNRLSRMEAEAGTKDALKQQPDGVMKDLTQRGLDMQASPIDLATALAPVLRGGKAMQAAQAGGTAAAVAARVLKGGAKEALQEGTTEYLQDPRATASQVAEAAGLGAVGSTVVEGSMAGTGAAISQLTRPKGSNEQQVSNDQTAAASGAGAAANPTASVASETAAAAGPQTIGGRPVLIQPGTAEERAQVAGMNASTPQQRALDGLPPEPEPMSMAEIAGRDYTKPQNAPGNAAPVNVGGESGNVQGGLQGALNAQEVAAPDAPGQAGVTPAAAPEQAADVAVPVNQGRARMAEKILVSQGVQPDVAAVMGARLHEDLDPNLDAETFRQRVLTDFEARGGVLPGSVGNAFVEDAAAYEAQGYSAEEAAAHAANAKAHNDATRAQVMAANKGLLKTPEKAKDPEPDSNELNGLQTQEVPLNTLSLSKDVPQFKSDANDEGVVEPLAGKYERLGTVPVLIWERLNGKREVISGRHRFDLAKRTGEKTIPAQIVREADGFTLQHALTADAELNIRDGHGKTKDFANYFRHAGLTDAEAESRGLRARAAGRAGWAIGTQASQAVFDLHQNGKLTDAQAEALATTAPNNEALQRAGVLAMNRGMPIDVTVNLLKAMQLEMGAAPSMGQMDLFGADDSAMLRMEEQARKATEIQRGLKEQVAAVQGAAKRPEKAKQLGVNVKDPAAVLKRVNELRAELYRWESWPLHADLREQVRGAESVPTGGFGLQSATPEQMAQEQAAAERKAEIAKRQQAPLSGSAGEYGTPDMLDNTAGDMALFNQLQFSKSGALDFVDMATAKARMAAGNFLTQGDITRLLQKRQAVDAQQGMKQVERKSVLDSLKLVMQKLPWLQNGRLLVFKNAADFLASNYARPQRFTADELAGMRESEAFFDPLTGHTIVLTNQIEVRDNETPIRAAARVLLHERVGHDGVNVLMQNDPVFADRIRQLVAKIPEAELDGIGADPGYMQLTGDRLQLGLEWLARQAESIEGARNAAEIEGGLQGVAKQMWQAIKEWLARFFADFSRKAALANEVHDIINLAREAAQIGTADPTSAEGLTVRVQFSMGGTRIWHAAGTPYRVNDRAWRAILTGSALPRAFTEAVEMTERERKALDQRTAQVGNDLKTAVESYAEQSGQPLADVYTMVNDALSGAPGTNAVLMQVAPVLHQRALEARTLLDTLSEAVARTLPVGDLRNTIMLNQGAWMRRSYAAFDAASGWNFDNVMQAARDGRMLGGRDARAIVAAARVFLRGQNPNATAQEIDADMRDLMDRDLIAGALAGTAAVRNNISSLLLRRDIPRELRELMGEEKNPIKRFLQSTSFQSQFIHRYQQQIALRNIGLQGGLFQTVRGGPAGVFNQQIPTEDRQWSGLAGLWTTPQLWQAMQNLKGANTGTDLWSHAGEALKALGNEAKLNRVAMNPDSWVVNALGNVVAMVQTGDVFYSSIFRRVREAVTLMQSGRAKPGAVAHNAAQALQDAQRAMVARLTASGVLGQNFNLRDLEASIPRHLLAWVNEDQTRDRVLGGLKGAIAGQAAGRGFGLPGRVVGGAIGAAVGGVAGLNQIQSWQQAVANYVMTGPDAIARLTGFLGNLETAHAAGMQGDAAYAHAVERTRNTFPDYGRMPEILKTMSRYGVAGSFIGFQYEVYRNTIHNLRYAWQDIRSGNPALVERGIKRTIGVAVVGSLVAGGMQAIFQGIAGSDDERNKKWRKWFGAPWEKNGVLVFTNYGDKSVSYFNTSYLVPQATLMELVNAAAAGKNPVEAAGNLTAHVWEQFMGSSVHLGPILSAVTNTDRMGRPLTYEKGILGLVERLDAAGQTILEPGWAAKMERLEYAMREAERKGRMFSVEEEMKRLVGVREFTRTWQDMVKGKYNDFATRNSDIRNAANRELAKNLPGAKGAALTRANDALAALDAELKEFEADMKTLGVPGSIVRAARKESSIPRVLYKVELDKDGKRVKSIGVR